MTNLLEKAFIEAAKLTEDEQNQLAAWILETIEDEKKWDELFNRSQDLLAQLADEALKEHLEGKTQLIDLDEG